MLRKLITITGLGSAALILFLIPTEGIQAQRLCPADRPCITELYQNSATLIIGWDGHENFDHYNFRWSRPGKAETQSEVRGGSRGSFRINNTNSGTGTRSKCRVATAISSENRVAPPGTRTRL